MSSLINEKGSKPIRPLQESESTEAQQETERECQPYYVDMDDLAPDQIIHLRQTGLLPPSGLQVQLLRDKHIQYLSQVWKHSLRAPFVSLDSSRPWMLYWCLHGCDLLDGKPTDQERGRMVSTLEHCWCPFQVTDYPVTRDQDTMYYFGAGDSDMELTAGGFGGGPNQMAHAATTYAAVLSLCILATSEGESSGQALALLRKIRIPLYRWMVGLQQPETGGYRMHHDGEVDVRASYTILCCATLLKIATPYLCRDVVVQFIKSCQTYEGGLGGEPWSEAHGGYAYCGVAALQLLGKLDVLDLPALTGWLARRQMTFEGGFSGRSNKLVDGCYSFWQGGAMAITSAMYKKSTETDPWLEKTSNSSLSFPLYFDAPMLERYILLCAQDIHGGLRDKPSKTRDFYHSCYNLSGLSVAIHCDDGDEMYGDTQEVRVGQTHPCYNIRLERVRRILRQNW
jgi:protein farnesyltransferase subunit beta